jgi:hypothetical protein
VWSQGIAAPYVMAVGSWCLRLGGIVVAFDWSFCEDGWFRD